MKTYTHQGKMLALIVSKSPYTKQQIAKRLGISRTTLYRKFKQAKLASPFIDHLSFVLDREFLSYELQAGYFSKSGVKHYTHIIKRSIMISEHHLRVIELLTKLLVEKYEETAKCD